MADIRDKERIRELSRQVQELRRLLRRRESTKCELVELGELLSKRGIYFFCSRGKVEYIGQSRSIGKRLARHHIKFSGRMFFLPLTHDSEFQLEIERHLIGLFRPPMNKVYTMLAVPRFRDFEEKKDLDPLVLRRLRLLSDLRIKLARAIRELRLILRADSRWPEVQKLPPPQVVEMSTPVREHSCN